MQVRAQGLSSALSSGQRTMVWIHGEEPLLMQECADAVRAHWRTVGFEERRVWEVDRSFRIADMIAESSTLSLFSSRKLIELRLTGKPTREFGDALATWCPTLGEDLALIVTSPRLDRATLQAAWMQPIDAMALMVAVYEVERTQLPAWIGQQLARQGQRADPATLSLIAERVEGNLLAAHQEIQKLGLLFAPGPLPAEQVRAAILNVARYDAFDLADAMVSGDLPRAMRTLEGLRQEGEAEPLVLWALSDALRTLLRAAKAVGAGRAASQVLRESRIYPPRDQSYEQALRRASPVALCARMTCALQQAARTDRIIKGLLPGNAWRGLADIIMLAVDAPLATQTDD
jgi:DNA polymerase III subunit delta